MSAIGQHSLKDIAARVESLDIPGAGHPQPLQHYAVCGGKLVSTRSARGVLRRIGRAIRRGRGNATYIALPVRAELGLVKNNLRLLGYRNGGRFSIKIGLPGIARNGSLWREIHTRRIIQSRAGGELLPTLYDYDRRRGHWLIEQEIWQDRKVTPTAMATLFLDSHAQRFYQASTRLHGIGHRLPPKLTLGALCLELPVSLNSRTLTKLKWPVALCHGDLSMGNMMFDRSERRLCLVDWEKGSAAPVAFDLTRLFETFPDGRAAILDLLSRLSGGDAAAAPANLQMAAALAGNIVLLKSARQLQVQYLVASSGLSLTAAGSRIEQTLASKKKLIGLLV